MPPVAFETTQDIVDLAMQLVEPYRSLKSLRLPIEVDEDAQNVAYTESALIIPAPTSLLQAVQDILLVSILESHGFRTTDIPLVISSLVQNLSDLIVKRFEGNQPETVRLEIDEKNGMYIPYGRVGIDDTHIRIVFLPTLTEIHTSEVTLVKLHEETNMVKKPFVDSLALKYHTRSGNFRVRVKKKLMPLVPLLEGDYIVYRQKDQPEEIEQRA